MKSGDLQAVDYLLVNLMSPAQRKPDWETALAYRKLYSTSGTEKSVSHKIGWKFDTSNFKTYGTGVYLYFRLLQLLFYTFLLIFLVSLPALLSNYKGDGLSMYGEESLMKSLMKMSLGNQRYEEFDNIIKDKGIATDIEVSQYIIRISDIMCSLVFLLFLILWKIISDEAVKEMISEDALPSYYTLKIRDIPSSANYRQEAVITHFQKFGGKVADVSTVYDYDLILSEVKTLLSLIEQFSGAHSDEKKQIYEQIAAKVKDIFRLFKQKPMKPVVCLVTFQDMDYRNKIRNLYKYEVGPRDLKMNGNMLKVSTCREEPSSIIWENFHLGTGIQFRQGLCIFTILLFVLLLALLALFLANARATSVIEHEINFTSQIDYSKGYTFAQAKALNTNEVIFNFCSKLDYRNLTLKFSKFCAPYFNSYKQRLQGMILLSLLVVVINLILNWIIYELANYRRYRTKTEKSRFLILNIFILYFINSGILLMLIRLEIGDYSLGRLVNNLIHLPPDQFSIEAYSDFTRKWYLHIGSQIVTVYAVSLLISPFLQIVVNWVQMRIRIFRAKRARTQKQMNQLILDSEFDFQTFYAMLLNACFLTMFYANAIPILYLLAAIAFLSLYIASFIVFKYFSCKPVMFDHTLNKVISKVMCVSLILHQLTTLLYVYTEDIFPLHSIQDNHHYAFWHKFQQGYGYMVFAIVLLIFTCNYTYFCKLGAKAYHKYYRGRENQNQGQMKSFTEVFHGGKVAADAGAITVGMNEYLSSYRMQDNPLYCDICYALSILNTFQPYFSSSKEIKIKSEEMPAQKISSFLEENLESDRPML